MEPKPAHPAHRKVPLASPGLPGVSGEGLAVPGPDPPLCLTSGRLWGLGVSAPWWPLRTSWVRTLQGCPQNRDGPLPRKGPPGNSQGHGHSSVETWCVWATRFHISCLEPGRERWVGRWRHRDCPGEPSICLLRPLPSGGPLPHLLVKCPLLPPPSDPWQGPLWLFSGLAGRTMLNEHVRVGCHAKVLEGFLF